MRPAPPSPGLTPFAPFVEYDVLRTQAVCALAPPKAAPPYPRLALPQPPPDWPAPDDPPVVFVSPPLAVPPVEPGKLLNPPAPHTPPFAVMLNVDTDVLPPLVPAVVVLLFAPWPPAPAPQI